MSKLLDFSNPLTVSVRTEAMLIKTKEGNYFVEFPTNKLPRTTDFLVNKKNKVTILDEDEYKSLSKAFTTFKELHNTKPFLHAPSFLIAWCESEGLKCNMLD